MFPFSRFSRQAPLSLILVAATIGVAGAATFHRLAVTQTVGSEGDQAVLQSSASGSAFQGEVGGSAPNTGLKLPFGVLGEYDAPGSTFGIGTLGISTTGYALAGESLSNAQPSILAYAGGKGSGLEATTQSTSSSPAIFSQSNGTGDGVDGAVMNGSSLAGVLGEDLSNANGLTDGVLGTTTNGGYGVEGSSSDSALGGMHGVATTGTGVFGDNQYGVSQGGSVTPGAYAGVYAASAVGDALYATTGDSITGYFVNSSHDPTLDLSNESTATGAYLFYSKSNNCNPCASIDTSGNLNVVGTVSYSGGSLARTRNPSSDLMSYGEEAAEPTMEDVGSARLVNGSATVPLAADFRQTIDGSQYMVFITPYGENGGLYIASRTASGFVVREGHAGRSTLAFDYRIVARRYGARDGRLPHYSALNRNVMVRGDGVVAQAPPPSPKRQRANSLLRHRHRYVPPALQSFPLLRPVGTIH